MAGIVQNPNGGHPDSGRPPITNGGQGGSVQVGTVTQPVRHQGKPAGSPLGGSGSGVGGYGTNTGGPEQPVRHVGRGGAPLR